MPPRKPPLTPRERALQIIDGSMPESTLEGHVKALCGTYGALYVHHRESRGTTPGWPDDVIIGPIRADGTCNVIIVELKAQTGRIRPAQKDVMARLTAAGFDVRVWRPSDLRTGSIRTAIAALSTTTGADK